MKVIIIDDEQKGRESLQKLIKNYCKEAEVVAMTGDITEAYELILEHKPHVVFLDVEMPGGDGFSLLNKFTVRDFKVIMVTAFDDYAIRAVRHQAFDYLLKPVDIDDLISALDAAAKSLQSEGKLMVAGQAMPEPQRLSINSRLPLPVKEGIFYLMVHNIMRIESDGGYCTFHTCDAKKYVVARNLKDYEDLLPDKKFFRVHKSHLINIDKVKKYIRTDGNFLEMEDGAIVEISRRRKDEFLQIMGTL